MIAKNEYKDEMLKSVKTLKAMYNYEFIEEERLFSLLDQLAETMFDCQHYDFNSPERQIFINAKIKRDLEQEKHRALSSIVMHKGSYH